MPTTTLPTHLRDLIHDPRNPRLHTPRNLGQLEHVLQTLGPMRSIVIDEDNIILAGNGVVEAAASAGIEHVRVYDRDTGEFGPPPPDGEPHLLAVRVTGLTEAQKREYAVADNRTGELSSWDTDVLAELVDDGVDLGSYWFPEELTALLPGDDEPPTLDQLAEQYGDPDETAFWPEIKVRVSPETFETFESLLRLAPGETDAARVRAILEAVDAGAFSHVGA